MSAGPGGKTATAVSPIKRCGNCLHGVPHDLQTVTCFGSPPTPVVISAFQRISGGTNLKIELLRPQLPKNERGCALWATTIPPQVSAPQPEATL